jgi:NAD(P)-dependent dehydrogenase (short-subunit alcohol dehydrogenase family)
LTLLAEWNGEMNEHMPEPLIAEAWLRSLQDRLAREVPLGRLVGAREDTAFAAYLCSDAADCFVGQVFPVCGGWAVR